MLIRPTITKQLAFAAKEPDAKVYPIPPPSNVGVNPLQLLECDPIVKPLGKRCEKLTPVNATAVGLDTVTRYRAIVVPSAGIDLCKNSTVAVGGRI